MKLQPEILLRYHDAAFAAVAIQRKISSLALYCFASLALTPADVILVFARLIRPFPAV